MGGPVNTGYRVVSLLPHWKTVTFPQFTFAHSYLFYLSVKILILWIKHLCYAQLNKCRWIALVNHTWHCLDLKQAYIILGVLWHLWAKINPNNIQPDFRGWTNEGNRSDYKGVKNDSCQMVLWTPTAETSQPNLSFLQKHKSNKTCFITIHKILMFAISHAACQTLHFWSRRWRCTLSLISIERVVLLDVMENTHS